MASKLSLFLAELKRRKVTRVAVVYALVGLGVIEGASMILPTLQLEAAYNYIVIFVLFGFPIALVLAWALEVTPQGIQKTTDLTPEQLATQAPDKWRASSWVLAGVGLVAVGVMGYFVFSGDGEPVLSQEILAVMPFENMTGDEAQDDIGRMASMVLTQALEKTGLVTVRNFDMALSAGEYIRVQADAGGVPNRLAAFASEVGAGTIVHGAYNLESGQLIVTTSITDVESGTSYPSPEPVSGNRDSPMEVLDALKTRVMAALALQFDQDLAPYLGQTGRMPTWEASREFLRGAKFYFTEQRYEDAVNSLLRSHELDPGFFTPLVLSLWPQANLSADGTPGARARLESTFSLIAGHESELTPYEEAVTRAKRAQFNSDRGGFLRGYEDACNLSPGSKACFNFGVTLLTYVNDPRRSIEVLTTELQPETGWMRGWKPYWRDLSAAYHVAGEPALALEVADKGREYYPGDYDLALRRLFPMVALGRVEEVLAFLKDSLSAFPNENHGSIGRTMGNALDSHGFDDGAMQAWELSVRWFEDRIEEDPDNPSRHSGIGHTLYNLGRLDDSDEHFRRAVSLTPADHYYRASLGRSAAKRGDRAEGRRVMEWLDSQEEVPPTQVLRYKARIAAALGEKEEAVGYLEELWTPPSFLDFSIFSRYDPFPSLYGYQPYEDVHWPEGRTRH